jgi:hypothetical protein
VSDKSSSAIHWLRDSSLQIVSALVGSSLLVTIITTLYSEINQPNVYLSVIPHITVNATDEIDSQRDPRVAYYETIVKNNGKKQATNMTLSVYFNGDIADHDTFFTSETVEGPKITKRTTEAQEMSLLRWDIPRLAPGALMTFLVTTDEARKFDPYYVTATFDEGSQTYPQITGYDIQSERFPNILAGRQDTQTISLLLITFVVLCVISFTIAITHKNIKDIMKKRRESSKWKKIKFNMFLAVPITILSSILVLYVCEEIPRSILLQSLIIPPLDATDGASIEQTVVEIRGIVYTQGTLLLTAGIFWSISFFARSLLTYFIAKIIIKRLYPDKHLPKRFLASASIFIMGEPLASSIILFFNKSTYNTEPVYLFFLFLVLDIIRMLILVLLIPKIFVKNNDLLYYGLIAISLVTGLSQLLLFGMLLELDLTNEPTRDFGFMMFCLIAGILQLTQIILIRSKEKSKTTARVRSIGAASISVGLILFWILIINYVTYNALPILFTGLPIVLTGIIIIVLDTLFIGLLRLISIRKLREITLKLTSLESTDNGNNTSSEPCFPVCASINVRGKLEYKDSGRKLTGKQKIILDNGEHRGIGNSTFDATTDEVGNFESRVMTPSYAGTFKMQGHLEGFSRWSSNILFTIDVTPSANSEELTYSTRLRNVSLSVLTGTVDRDGQFIPRKEFEPRELITFVVSLLDTDAKVPICGETNIRLRLYGEDNQKVTNPLPPTDGQGKTYASVRAPPIASGGWIFQAFFPGNSIYASVNTPMGSYGTVLSLSH